MSPLKTLTFGLLALVAIPSGLQARNIQWGGSIGSSNLDSSGSPLTASYSFQLGTFGSSFTPNAANASSWSSNWVPFDTADYNPAAAYFTGSADLEQSSGSGLAVSSSTGLAFAPGDQAYIWVYNNQSLSDLTEWSLLTNDGSDGDANDDWLMPEPASHSLPLQWRVSGASDSILGGANGESSEDGFRTSTTTDFDLQTHKLVVPEPSSALLFLFGSMLFAFRRQRS
ncbi:MAG: PEP-CTERM sorting domain-containing protein [Verrucomicrobiota bacterium]